MGIAIDHFLAPVSDPLLNDNDGRTCHHQRAHSVMPEPMHAASFESELTKCRVKMLVQRDAVN